MIVFLNNCLDLLVSFLDLDFLNLWFFPLIALCFLATIPCIVRALTIWR